MNEIGETCRSVIVGQFLSLEGSAFTGAVDMNGLYAYTPYIWPTIGTILLLLFLIGYSWQRRNVPGVPPFIVYLLLGVGMLTCKAIGYLAVDFPTKVFWFRIETNWWLPVVGAMTCFSLEYTYPGRWLTRRNLILLTALVLIIDIVGLTNDYNHLTFRGFAYNGTVVPLYGPWSWLGITFMIGLTMLSIMVFTWLFIHSPQHRWPVAMMLVAIMLTRSLGLFNPFPRDSWFLYFPTIVTSYIAVAIALFGFRIFDPVPMARRTVIEQLHAGMIVLDPQERVASLNPAAERILNTPAKQVKGKRLKELLPAYPEKSLADSGETEIELALGKESSLRHYILTVSPLNDFRGCEAGRLLLLRDVTEQKRAQATVLEQQRSLATLQERERLARELHDSLGQTLAATHLQAGTARVLLAQGETAQTDECLQQMADMTIAAEADVREYLLGAKTVFSPDHPFFASLREYMARFSQQYGLSVELSIPSTLDAQGLGQRIEVQLMRIIQEALSNIRKHAHAQNVQVAFTVVDSWVQITITDDGQGFDPAAVTARQAEGFGLQAMRERAEALGGSLEVLSQPGLGTKVIVHAPIQGESGLGEAVQ